MTLTTTRRHCQATVTVPLPRSSRSCKTAPLALPTDTVYDDGMAQHETILTGTTYDGLRITVQVGRSTVERVIYADTVHRTTFHVRAGSELRVARKILKAAS